MPEIVPHSTQVLYRNSLAGGAAVCAPCYDNEHDKCHGGYCECLHRQATFAAPRKRVKREKTEPLPFAGGFEVGR